MANEIIFYDLPSKGKNSCWSLNPWKARAALNYKNLPYRTEWIEYPDLAPHFQSLGIPPNNPTLNPNAPFSIPAAKFPPDHYIMDSLAIARELEVLQPDPPLYLDDLAVPRAQASVLQIMATLGPNIYPRIPETLLNSPSAEYFLQTRGKRFGMPLARLREERGGEAAWEAAAGAFGEIRDLLADVPDGPYVRGSEVSFADFVLAGFWRFVEKLDREGDLLGRIMGMDRRFGEHYEACRRYLERDD